MSEKIIKDLIAACEKGEHWMNMVSKAQLSSATRGLLTCDIGEVGIAVHKAKQFLSPQTTNEEER